VETCVRTSFLDRRQAPSRRAALAARSLEEEIEPGRLDPRCGADNRAQKMVRSRSNEMETVSQPLLSRARLTAGVMATDRLTGEKPDGDTHIQLARRGTQQ